MNIRQLCKLAAMVILFALTASSNAVAQSPIDVPSYQQASISALSADLSVGAALYNGGIYGSVEFPGLPGDISTNGIAPVGITYSGPAGLASASVSMKNNFEIDYNVSVAGSATSMVPVESSVTIPFNIEVIGPSIPASSLLLALDTSAITSGNIIQYNPPPNCGSGVPYPCASQHPTNYTYSHLEVDGILNRFDNCFDYEECSGNGLPFGGFSTAYISVNTLYTMTLYLDAEAQGTGSLNIAGMLDGYVYYLGLPGLNIQAYQVLITSPLNNFAVFEPPAFSLFVMMLAFSCLLRRLPRKESV